MFHTLLNFSVVYFAVTTHTVHHSGKHLRKCIYLGQIAFVFAQNPIEGTVGGQRISFGGKTGSVK